MNCRMNVHSIFWLAASAVTGCTPEPGAPPSLVSETRLLAVRGEPAEAAPGAMVHFTTLVASPTGTVAAPAFTWSFCLDPKPLAENNAIAAACIGDATAVGVPVPSLDAALPADGCALFGPDVPPPMPGQPALRPRDPDVTGGYYQPLKLDLPGPPDLIGVALERITCELANAPVDVVRDFTMRYQANRNPAIAAVLGAPEGQPPAPIAMLPSVAPGARLALEVQFADGAAETYPVYDTTARTLVDHREALRVSWFAAAGAFDHDRTGRGEDETALTTDDTWTAPAASGAVPLWVVLRDSRGGVDFASFTVTVQ